MLPAWLAEFRVQMVLFSSSRQVLSFLLLHEGSLFPPPPSSFQDVLIKYILIKLDLMGQFFSSIITNQANLSICHLCARASAALSYLM